MSAELLNKPLSVQELPDQLPLLEWITEADRVKRLSHDFSWFSPTLKRELAEKKAEIVARPRNIEEIQQVVAACAKALIPITVRGAGTNSKGQSTPIHGGLVLDISGYSGFSWIRGQLARAQAGIRLSEFNDIARQKGLELSCTPAAFGEGTLGGILAGGVDGAGGQHGQAQAAGYAGNGVGIAGGGGQIYFHIRSHGREHASHAEARVSTAASYRYVIRR